MIEQFFPIKDPILIFALLMLIAVIAPFVSSKLKLPGIIGLIVTGIILGPHALGVLERGSEIKLLGTVGLLYIMFLAGLELDRIQFKRHIHHSLVFGVLTFSIPLFFGTLLAHYILEFNWPASILLASMFSSHTLLTYPIASRLGLSRQRAVTTTIGGTIFTDTAALLVLAIIAAAHKGESSIFFWQQLFTAMAIYVAAVIIILPRLGKHFFRNMAADNITIFAGVIAIVYLCAYLAHLAGLEPIIGAFLAGMILNSLIPEKSTLMNRIQFVGHALFIPFFLISVGMLVNVRLLFARQQTLVVAAVMIFSGITTKWLAAYSTEKILKYTPEEGKLIYGLSVNQAAATLAAVLVGYNIGIFNEPVLTGTIIMILVTSLTGSWLTDRFARKVALNEEEAPYRPSEAPHRILIPLANPNTAKELMNLAMLLRRHKSTEPLYPLTVVQAGDRAEERIAQAEKLLGHAVVQAGEGDVSVTPITRTATDLSDGIQQAAVDLRISTIITGWRGKPSSRSQIFGRILDVFLENSSQMVFISRCLLPINTMKRVILAVPPLMDHQPGFSAAIEAIKNLTHQLNASLLTVSVPATITKVREIIKNYPPKISETDLELKRWDELFPWLNDNLNKDDLFILTSVRKGRLAWQPNLNRLPRLINQQFSEINQLFVYPPEKPWCPVSEMDKSKLSTPSFFPANHIKLNLDETTISEAIASLIQPAFPNHPKMINKITKFFTQMAQTDPIEISPGVILLHAHISEIQVSTAFLGINKKGWRLSHASEDVKALLILLSSKEAPPEVHLKALAELAQPLHHHNASQQLTKLTSVEEALQLFSK